MNLSSVLLVGVGGFVGSIARYLVARSVGSKIELMIPFGTLVVNVVGSFILGVVFAVVSKRMESEWMTLLLGVGFCGGFTTFSSFALDNYLLLEQRNFGAFALYSILTFVLCMVSVASGAWLGNKA